MRPVLGPPLTTSVEENSINHSTSLKVYPNPSQQNIYVELPVRMNYRNIKVEFFDIYGRSVFSSIESNHYRMVFDVSSLQQGMYILHLTSDDGEVMTGKFFVAGN